MMALYGTALLWYNDYKKGIDMGTLHVRGVRDDTLVRLKALARSNGLTLSEYIRRMVESLSIIGEIRELDDKYTRLVMTVADTIERHNNVVSELEKEVAALRRKIG